MNPLLDIERLSVEFDTGRGRLQAVSDVSFSMKAGEIVCLVGESGSGKTVTSKAIMRLIDDENGSIAAGAIKLDGVDVAGLSRHALRSLRGKKMAMVFQEPMAAFDPVFTIGSQIVETIRRHNRKETSSQAWHRAVELLRRVGIPEPELRMKQYPNELSGGMLQRAMIAMALSCEPELLIADEPTTALDVTIQAQILQLLQDLKTEYNMSILLITHDLGIAAEIADRIIVMYAGQVVEKASKSELFEQPHHLYTGSSAVDNDDGQRPRKASVCDSGLDSQSCRPARRMPLPSPLSLCIGAVCPGGAGSAGQRRQAIGLLERGAAYWRRFGHPCCAYSAPCRNRLRFSAAGGRASKAAYGFAVRACPCDKTLSLWTIGLLKREESDPGGR